MVDLIRHLQNFTIFDDFEKLSVRHIDYRFKKNESLLPAAEYDFLPIVLEEFWWIQLFLFLQKNSWRISLEEFRRTPALC